MLDWRRWRVFLLDSSSKTSTANNGINQESDSITTDKRPLWVQEEELRQREPLKNVRFLRERGYTSSEAMVACGGIGNNNSSTASKMYALKQLYNSNSSNETVASSSDEGIVEVPEDIVQARIEEKEVLVSMFGFANDNDEAAARFNNLEDEHALDVVLPVTAYEPPGRYYSLCVLLNSLVSLVTRQTLFCYFIMIVAVSIAFKILSVLSNAAPTASRSHSKFV